MKNTIDYDLPYKWNYYKQGSNSPAVAFRDENSGFRDSDFEGTKFRDESTDGFDS